MTDPDLKNCPFCNNEPSIIVGYSKPNLYVKIYCSCVVAPAVEAYPNRTELESVNKCARELADVWNMRVDNDS